MPEIDGIPGWTPTNDRPDAQSAGGPEFDAASKLGTEPPAPPPSAGWRDSDDD